MSLRIRICYFQPHAELLVQCTLQVKYTHRIIVTFSLHNQITKVSDIQSFNVNQIVRSLE